ncbi:hypothetical protein DPMN_042737 [Dreissena polymorpha]|uniref:Uncharacterized protein n=1 Tax=Dreissena polymorpha TaxID=45954 RepID=A0A9D4D1K3_DREPO|nr:hypothetical protein DPMN_042737 [Dreissena polymorpha]
MYSACTSAREQTDVSLGFTSGFLLNVKGPSEIYTSHCEVRGILNSNLWKWRRIRRSIGFSRRFQAVGAFL